MSDRDALIARVPLDALLAQLRGQPPREQAATRLRRRRSKLHGEGEAPQRGGVDVVNVVRQPERGNRVLLEQSMSP